MSEKLSASRFYTVVILSSVIGMLAAGAPFVRAIAELVAALK